MYWGPGLFLSRTHGVLLRFQLHIMEPKHNLISHPHYIGNRAGTKRARLCNVAIRLGVPIGHIALHAAR